MAFPGQPASGAGTQIPAGDNHYHVKTRSENKSEKSASGCSSSFKSNKIINVYISISTARELVS